jgi:hypothetical protein
MLDVIVGLVVGLLVLAGILVMLGPNLAPVLRRLRAIERPTKVPAVFLNRQQEVFPPGSNPKTQRVLLASARLASWLRAEGNENLARELRAAAARITTNEPAGLYALQAMVRKVRALKVDEPARDRLKALSQELHTAVQDRFEQLELLPFRRP